MYDVVYYILVNMDQLDNWLDRLIMDNALETFCKGSLRYMVILYW